MTDPGVSPKDEAAAFKAAADRAMGSGDLRGARELLQQAVARVDDSLGLWMSLAACNRGLGDVDDALTAVERALAVEPRNFMALLMKASLLERQGRERPAGAAYGVALTQAPSPDRLPEPTRIALAHAREVHDRYTAQMAGALSADLAKVSGRAGAVEAARIETFIGGIAGRRRIYQQEPIQFNYPGLPAIEFHERTEFPWLEGLEACTDDIRGEVLAVWGDGSPQLEPYVSYPDGVPLDQWAELNKSLNWSAFHLLFDGAPVAANCARCPATMAALALVDQPKVHDRSPSAMFSILKAHTRIPPHTGVANTRLVLHLPLIVPDGCGFRVGGETRQWREGHAWVFDDTIEHEAWNDGDRPRAILICDVWSPHLSAAERELVAQVIAALDRFNQGGQAPAEP
ncbi:MAG TPA: aspartyl/asparaginyl beta-hydroxylase domain-containing protein [Caulobacteraceae bacterium]